MGMNRRIGSTRDHRPTLAREKRHILLKSKRILSIQSGLRWTPENTSTWSRLGADLQTPWPMGKSTWSPGCLRPVGSRHRGSLITMLQILSFTTDADVGHIPSPPSTDASAIPIPSLFKLLPKAGDPSQDGRMSDLNTALGYHVN